MKTTANGRISAAQEALRQGTGWSVYYVAHLTAGGSTHYYSTRAITLSGNAYIPEMVSTGGLERSLGEGRDLLGLVDATDIVFANNRTTDSDEGASAGTVEQLHNLYRLEGAAIQVGLLFADAAADADDIIWLSSLVVDDVQISDEPPSIALRCVDSTLATGERPVGRLVDSVTFPESYKQARGKMLPIVFGSVRDAPLIPIDVGFTGAIDGSLLFNETTIYVTDITDFPDTGSAWIEDEVVRWTSRDTANHALLDVVRGEQSTVATDHPDGSALSEYKTGDERYRFAVADHACNAVTNVRAGGKLRTAGSGDEEYVSTTLADPYGEGRDIQVVEFKQPPRYSMTSAYGRALPIIQEADEEEQEFEWSKGDDDNLGTIDGGDYDGTDYAELCIDQSIPRIGAALQGDKNHLQLTLDTDLSNGRLGSIRRARVKCEYFTMSEETHGAAIKVSHDGTEIASAPLAAATPEDLDVTGAEHDHGLDSGDTGRAGLSVPTEAITFEDNDVTHRINFDLVDLTRTYWMSKVLFDSDLETWRNFSTTSPDGNTRTYSLDYIKATRPLGQVVGPILNLRVVAVYTDGGLYGKVTLPNDQSYTGSCSNRSTLGSNVVLEVTDCDAKGITWDMLESGDITLGIGVTARGYIYTPSTTVAHVHQVWIEVETDSTFNAWSAHQNAGVSGSSEVSGLEDIAASSSLAIQTVPFTYALDQYVTANALADRWAIFDGTLDLDIVATGTIPDGSSDTDDRIYVTRLWVEIELREATIVLDWNGLTANVEGITRSGALIQNPVDVMRYVLLSPDTANGVPDLGYMGLAQSAIDTISADRTAHRYNGGYVSGYPDLPQYKVNRRVDQPTSALTLLASLCRDTHMRVFREGETFQFHVVDIALQEPVATLDGASVLRVVSKSQTTTGAVANEVSVRYNADYAFGAAVGYESQVTWANLESQALPWGKRAESFTAPWLTNQDTDHAAYDLALFWSLFLGTKWTRIVLECPLEAVDFERQDAASIDLPYQGIPGLIGRVVGVRFPRLDVVEAIVEVPQYSSRCFYSDYQDANNMWWRSPGNKMLSLRLAGIEATWFSPTFWNSYDIQGAIIPHRHTGAAEIVDAYVSGSFPAYAYINYKKTADSNWTAALRISIGSDGRRLVEVADHLTIYTNYPLSGETGYAQCIYGDQTEGSTTISLGGAVVCKITGDATATLPANGLFLSGEMGTKDNSIGGTVRR